MTPPRYVDRALANASASLAYAADGCADPFVRAALEHIRGAIADARELLQVRDEAVKA